MSTPQMTGLSGRRIILGVTGGIAAYKAVEVCRRLVDAGAAVTPVLTAGAVKMVGEATFSALAGEPARTSLFDDPASPIPHTAMGQSADLVLVAPATARVVSDIRTGRSADLLTATILATRAPLVVCPAMHTEMWEQASVQENLEVLRGRGVHVVDPGIGRLAGGDFGPGRLAEPELIVSAGKRLLAAAAAAARRRLGGRRAEPELIVSAVTRLLAAVAAADRSDLGGRSDVGGQDYLGGQDDPGGRSDLGGRRVLVTAGGTREPIDAVRFVGNRSSGRQGHALARNAAQRGADVVLVTTNPTSAPSGVRIVEVSTAEEMHRACTAEAPEADLVVMAAAVADFRPRRAVDRKLKKDKGILSVDFEPTADILACLGAAKPDGQVLVGFAAETDNVESNAAAKLDRKNLDMIVANDVSKPGVGFEHETNEVVVLRADGARQHLPLCSKGEVARAVLDAAVETLDRLDKEQE
ncbi:MAG: bifunctional phosphopantothenoylcysteine decarboxylase/phosphopantothenate synthase [Acidimicrobiia bacterium]|nr:bifunctional phosphopantothenoylcysteine decarboxylase/phosphopantothenate synthase [Acidimicrobiia bacterium]